MTTTESDSLAAARARRDRVSADRREAEARLRELRASVHAADRAVEEAGIAAAMDPSASAAAALEAARAARTAAVDALDAAEERLPHLAAAERRLNDEIAALALADNRVRLDAARAALRARIAASAAAFRAFVADVVALDKLESKTPHAYPDDKVLDFVARQAGTSAGVLNDAGRALGAAIASGRAEV